MVLIKLKFWEYNHIPWSATAWNSIYKGEENTENPGSESRGEHATSM